MATPCPLPLPLPEDLSLTTTPCPPPSLLVRNEDLGLTAEESVEFESYQRALTVLGPAAGTVLMCPGNQANVADEDRCPYAAKCPLLRMQKAPENRMCPIERRLMEDRFNSWCTELSTDALTMLESDRVAVSDLVWIDLQEQRCLHILSRGDEARLTVTNPKDVHPETYLPISWEKVIHPNVELLVQLQTQRRMILKDWMLTPEQKWKREKAEGKGSGKDIASKQSARADKLRAIKSSNED